VFICASTITVNADAQDRLGRGRGQAVPVLDKDARIAELEARVAQQQAYIDRLELTAAKVGLPPLEEWHLHLGLWAMFLIGLAGEGVFFLRFVVQWYASEKRKQTVVPMLFWHLSLIGTFMVLAYAIYIINWVFILAYSLNVFLYVRNLTIARRTVTSDT